MSDAGKSVLVGALCRLLAKKGLKVAPFKPQNMALNSAVTAEGLEIGRAQAWQAKACGVEPSVHFNPVLLKPETDQQCQVILQGKVLKSTDKNRTSMGAWEFHHYKQTAMTAVLDSFRTLQKEYDFIVVEGAGSPAEINLREGDIANMGFAEAVDCPVWLAGDIDRGGVFAQLVGTLELLSESERQRVQGFIINKFRGDQSLLQPGLDWLESKTGKPVLAVMPYLPNLNVEAEDGIARDRLSAQENSKLKILVPVLPRISNHTDFDALKLNSDVDLQFIGELQPGQVIPAADLVILPGSKSVMADLSWLKQQGWDQYLKRHLRFGGKVVGICGGWQMLGQDISDPLGVESSTNFQQGLGFLDISTEIKSDKTLLQVCGEWMSGELVAGYEVHCGQTTGPALKQPWLKLKQPQTGELVNHGVLHDQVAGCYVHGVFDTPESQSALFQWVGQEQLTTVNYARTIEHSIEQLAQALETHLRSDILSLFQ